jgi:hypothetical protein
MLNEISQIQTEKYCMISLTYGIKKKRHQIRRDREQNWLPGWSRRREDGILKVRGYKVANMYE